MVDEGDCELSDRVDDVVSTTFGPHFIEWFELDLDVDPKALYFCSRSGCATGSFAHRDQAVMAVDIGAGITWQGGMDLLLLSLTTNWKVAFVVQVMDFPMYRSDILIFTLNMNKALKVPMSVDAEMLWVSDEYSVHSAGKCTQVGELSEPGNPVEWTYKSTGNPQKPDKSE